MELIGLLALTLGSALLRLEGRGISLWLDEALSVGIASHGVTEIPAVLVQDASPPLYYLLLHVWMAVFGTSEVAVRSLSLVFAVAMVPVAFWAGRSLFGRRVGWLAAALAATSPYLNTYAQEARMYTLVALLALVSITAFLHAFCFGHRRWRPVFVVALALLVYTHNWGLLLAAATGLAALVVAVLAKGAARRQVVGDIVVCFGAVAALYVPWLPTLLAQVRHNAPPWSEIPVLREAVSALGSVLGDERSLVALVVAAAVPMLVLMRRRNTAEGSSALALIVILGSSVAMAWVASQLGLGWSPRYFGIFLAPLVVIAALGLSRAGTTGLVALALIVAFWTQPLGRLTGARATVADSEKSNVRQVAMAIGPLARPGDLMVSAQMEQVPALRYYFGPDLRYATPIGAVADPEVVDWRDGLARMEAATPAVGLAHLVEALPSGHRVLLACPRIATTTDDLEWEQLMDHNCQSWRAALDQDPGMKLVQDRFPPPTEGELGTSVFMVVYQKVS